MKKNLNKQNFDLQQQKTEKKFELWLKLADHLKLNGQEKLRVYWMIYYEKEANKNVIRTCKHFNISRKTFYKWLNRFITGNNNIECLKNVSRKPYMSRNWEVSIEQEKRITELRKKNIYYGKKKLKVLYKKEYGEDISCWKIERVIRKHELYPNREKQKKTAGELTIEKENPKSNFVKFEKEKNLWFLFHMMITKIYWKNTKRYIITTVDHYSKLGYVRMYKTKNPRSIKDFLYRINHFIQQALENPPDKNSGKLSHFFEIDINKSINEKHFTYVKPSKNCTVIDRFSETFECEWLYDGNLDLDCNSFNKNLISWLIEYNFNRPHQKINYLTPIEYIKKKTKKAFFKKKMSPEHLVDSVLDYILNLDLVELETLSVENVSKAVGISQSRLWRNFKREKKITLKEFIIRLKINQAATLLSNNPELTVKEIADKMGYYCYDYFFKIFKKYFGTSPRKYRESKKLHVKLEKKYKNKRSYAAELVNMQVF